MGCSCSWDMSFDSILISSGKDHLSNVRTQEKPARGVRSVHAIDDGGISECTVMTRGVVGAKADREAVSCVQGAKRCLLEFLQGIDVRQG